MIERFLIIWLTLLSLVAYFWPALPSGSTSTSLDPFLVSKAYLPHMVAVTMLIIGSLLPADEIKQVQRRWYSVLLGTMVQYTAMPGLAFLFANLFHIQPPLLIGVIMVGCVPGAMASNVLTLVARGNVSYSVSLTTLATLLSPFAVPTAFYVLMRQHVDGSVLYDGCKTLTLSVVIPVLLGYLLSRKSVRWQQVNQRFGSAVANVAILWIIAVVVGLNRETLAQGMTMLLVVLALINGFGYLTGYSAGMLLGLPEPMRRALTIEIGMQNAGVGTMLALQLFPDSPEAAIPTAMYTFGCMFTGTFLASCWRLVGIGDSDEESQLG